jgi:GT2 family glycosyltransferase
MLYHSYTYRLAVVTVTYGNRAGLLIQSLRSVQSQARHILDVVIVFNGPGDRLSASDQSRLNRLRLHIVTNSENLGSAAGYGQGIGLACQVGASHVLLMDDDNIILDGALHVLEESIQITPSGTIPCLNRITRKKYQDILSGKCGNPIEKSNRFLGVGLDLTARVAGRPREVQSLPYSGLVIPSAAIEASGLPDITFFLYQDDRDFTYRLWLAGYSYRIIREAKIADLDESWGGAPRALLDRLIPTILRPESNDFKVFHSVRSRIIFNLKHQVTSVRIYRLNIVLVLSFVRLLALVFPGRVSFVRFCVIRDAIRAGLERGLKLNSVQPVTSTWDKR